MSFNYEPGSTFKVGDGLGGVAGRPDHAEHRIRHPRPDPGRQPHDPRRRGTPRRDAHHGADPRAVEQRRRDQDRRNWRAKTASTNGCTASASGPRPASICRARKRGQVLQPSEYSGSSMGNLPIGQGELVTPIQMATAYAAIANGGILRPPHIVAAVNGHPTKLPAGHRVISASTAAQVRQMLRGVLAPGGTASEVSVPGLPARGQDRHRQQDRPRDRRILRNRLRRLVHRLRAGIRPEAAVRGDRRRTADRLDLRRHRRRPGVRPDHGLRAAVPRHPVGVDDPERVTPGGCAWGSSTCVSGDRHGRVRSASVPRGRGADSPAP